MSNRTMTLDSAILRLAQERNEARELCKRLFYCLPAQGGEKDEEAINAAYYQYLEASRRWKGGGRIELPEVQSLNLPAWSYGRAQ